VSPANVKSAVEALNPDTGEPVVLLGTGTLSGGSTAITGLSLSNYIKLEVYLNNISPFELYSSVYMSSDNTNVGLVAAKGSVFSGKVDILLDTDTFYASRTSANTDNDGWILSTHNFTTSSTALYFKSDTSVFTGGTFRLYGVRG
jgi:hypothetical protein